MASILDPRDGSQICVGLQGCNVCDAAIQAAQQRADRLSRDVHLLDDDGEWIVHPAGDEGERQPASPHLTHKVEERGNGLPQDGDEVLAGDTRMVIAMSSSIQTRQWQANWIEVSLIPADRSIEDLSDDEYDALHRATAI